MIKCIVCCKPYIVNDNRVMYLCAECESAYVQQMTPRLNFVDILLLKIFSRRATFTYEVKRGPWVGQYVGYRLVLELTKHIVVEVSCGAKTPMDVLGEDLFLELGWIIEVRDTGVVKARRTGSLCKKSLDGRFLLRVFKAFKKKMEIQEMEQEAEYGSYHS